MRLHVAPSYPPPQLVQRAESEELAARNNDGVNPGDVDPVLDYGRGEEDVRFAAGEFNHVGLHRADVRRSTREVVRGHRILTPRALLHPSVCHEHLDPWDIPLQNLPEGLKHGDPGCHEEHLPTSSEFELHGLDDRLDREGLHGGLYGHPSLWASP